MANLDDVHISRFGRSAGGRSERLDAAPFGQDDLPRSPGRKRQAGFVSGVSDAAATLSNERAWD